MFLCFFSKMISLIKLITSATCRRVVAAAKQMITFGSIRSSLYNIGRRLRLLNHMFYPMFPALPPPSPLQSIKQTHTCTHTWRR
uniref:Putative secreted protein n=1 Tax=Anopheles darlingi TaxID=43151 RepID=A0A2M4DJ93_ANODA